MTWAGLAVAFVSSLPHWLKVLLGLSAVVFLLELAVGDDVRQAVKRNDGENTVVQQVDDQKPDDELTADQSTVPSTEDMPVAPSPTEAEPPPRSWSGRRGIIFQTDPSEEPWHEDPKW